ncbi:hypothetical protein J7L48_04005 [bacterium]|nr:hypothetical protein [bacterium]
MIRMSITPLNNHQARTNGRRRIILTINKGIDSIRKNTPPKLSKNLAKNQERKPTPMRRSIFSI